MSELDEIVTEFLLESYENLDRYDADVLALERDPTDGETLGAVFRTVHTLKGTCGSFGFVRLQAVAHVAENLLVRLRDGELTVTRATADALLATGDAVRGMLADIAATGREGPSEHADLIAALELLQGAGAAADLPPATEELPVVPEPASRTAPDRSVRVDIVLLDELTDLVAELVRSRDRMVELVTPDGDAALVAVAQRMGLLTTLLQQRVMRTRVRPLSTVLSRFPRLVRDVATSLGKEVELVTEGEATELDRNIIEAIRDPLTHLVRNAVDHGLETPAQRRSVGKPTVGRLILRAHHDEGLVRIEVTDDGAGIDEAALTRAAVDQGLVTEARAAAMTSREVLQLIFVPGLTTAGDVTDVSGRGVGMDVVRTDVGRIGGTVDVRTERGVGTSFEVTIPSALTLVPPLVPATTTTGGWA
jgi:two-component system, chemotaxis family, sensor kinase CheA